MERDVIPSRMHSVSHLTSMSVFGICTGHTWSATMPTGTINYHNYSWKFSKVEILSISPPALVGENFVPIILLIT